jgi:hypothetical protein
MGAANLWVWWRYLDALKVTERPALLIVVVPLLVVGLGLQAIALWRLQPHPARPAGTPARSRAEGGTSEQ